ncbi:helix-turn-helix domain-containing protein [Anaerocolumna sp. MB42-C2]|uniref:helix-turn-helix domain-containing protein n=1 Tax=Anaerocolumna sp. MB42-C2 TaxID=3070997 RepID=UPI0027DF2BB2|nr:helix-turn-helix domain-containing protein [Anaerocolumna sp. MB42-C2]WMJ87445.1 helix-turn-helix domain-containing protein [Anaerocolumna sp. MB42-C2]
MKTDYLVKVEQCIAYIEAHLTHKVSVEDVLVNTYYSYPHFHRIFMDIVGEPISSYIRKRKLSCAAEELINTQKKIVDIAIDYNFSSQQTFNRAFTGYFGVSPRKYRETGMLDELYKPFVLTNSFLEDLIPISVLIENLPPMKVASYHSYINNIKLTKNRQESERMVSKAWGRLIRWQMSYEYQKQFGSVKKLPATLKIAHYMIDNNLHLPPNTRYFGFVNPFPMNEDEFGYEAWAMLTNLSESPINETQNRDIIIKNYEGGLYATAKATYGPGSNLDEVWKSLHYWLSQNQQYKYGEHQWLEEHITKVGEGGFHGFKLFMPIKRVGNEYE